MVIAANTNWNHLNARHRDQQALVRSTPLKRSLAAWPVMNAADTVGRVCQWMDTIEFLNAVAN